jgi:hypothetical protein
MKEEIKACKGELEVKNKNSITNTQARESATLRDYFMPTLHDRLYFGPNMENECVVSTADVIWCRIERRLCTLFGTPLKGLSKTVGNSVRNEYLLSRLTSRTRTYKIG